MRRRIVSADRDRSVKGLLRSLRALGSRGSLVVLVVAMICAITLVGISGGNSQRVASTQLSKSVRLTRETLQVKFLDADFNGWQTAYAFDVLRGLKGATSDNAPSRKAFLESAAAFSQALATLSRESLSAPERAAANSARRAFDEFLSTDSTVIGLYRTGAPQDLKAASALVLGREITLFQQISSATDALTAMVRTGAAEADSAAAGAAASSRTALIAAGAIALLLMVLTLLGIDRTKRTERKRLQTERELRSERRFRGLLKAAPDGIAVVDHGGTIQLGNAQLGRMLGYDSAALTSMHVEMLLPERFRSASRDNWETILRESSTQGAGVTAPVFARRKDGCELAVEISIGSENGHRLVVFHDISGRLETEAEMRMQSEIMRNMAEGVMLARSSDQTITYANPKLEQMFGYRPGELSNQSARVLLGGSEADMELFSPQIRRELTRTGMWTGELPGVKRNGTGFSCQVSVTRFERPQQGAVTVGIFSDITERKQSEQASRRLAAIVEHTHDAVLAVSAEGLITEWNHGAEDLFGYMAREAVGRRLAELVAPELAAEQRNVIRRAFSGEAVEDCETVFLCKDDSKLDVTMTVSPVRDAVAGIVAVSVIARDISERKRYEGQLQYLADHDSLTGLFNRRRFREELERELARAKRSGLSGAVLAIDLDNFKYVNDSLGYSVGDQLIAAGGDLFARRVRNTDVLARIGGDEFALILPGATEDEARLVASSLVEAIRRDLKADFQEGSRPVTASIGISLFSGTGDLGAEGVLIEADVAMYDAKEGGRNKASVYRSGGDRQERLQARLTWGERIRRALQEDRLVLHAQPILPLTEDGHLRQELLVRMLNDNGDLVSPAAFLPVAERMDLIVQIDRWVTHAAIRLLAAEQHAGRAVALHANLSALSVGDEELPAFIADELKEARADGRGLCFEITETAAIINLERARQFAAHVAELGCEFALDDFGAGFASFYYLKHLPFDHLKIDGEFIKDLAHSRTDQLVVKSIVEIAHGLHKRTIAEFVSDRRGLELLKQFGVDYAQGFYVSQPKPLAQIDLTRPPTIGSSEVAGSLMR